MKSFGLGKGLEALIRDESAAGQSVVRIALSDIDRNEDQPRKRFEETALRELADSIAELGVIQPIIVRRNGSRFVIIAGERRFRAARMAGLQEIPALVREADKLERMQVALVENLQRADLNPVEEACAVQALIDECGLTQEAVSKRVGRSRPAVANVLRLLTLPEPVLQMLREGRLSAGHARALVTLADPARQTELALQAERNGWSVRQMEDAMRAVHKRAPAKQRLTPELHDFVDMARRAFGVKAQLSGTGKKGQLVLPYASPEELQRIWDVLESLGLGSGGL